MTNDQQPAARPMAGDAVRLAAPWPGASEVSPGVIGVIGGMLGEPIDGGSITFRASTYRDDRVVSCSGGPASIWTDASELVPTGETVEVRVWRFRNDRHVAGNDVERVLSVPLWDWYPGGKS